MLNQIIFEHIIVSRLFKVIRVRKEYTLCIKHYLKSTQKLKGGTFHQIYLIQGLPSIMIHDSEVMFRIQCYCFPHHLQIMSWIHRLNNNFNFSPQKKKKKKGWWFWIQVSPHICLHAGAQRVKKIKSFWIHPEHQRGRHHSSKKKEKKRGGVASLTITDNC